MDLKIEFSDTLDIARRGAAALPWLRFTETADEERDTGESWSIYAGGRLLSCSSIRHDDVVTALREVGWGWQELPNLGSDDMMFMDASQEVVKWACGMTETLSAHTCAAVVLAHHYGTRAGAALYSRGLWWPKKEAERKAREKAYPAVSPLGRLLEGE
ncbi:hypothetical protein [Streptomyces sp. NPDC018055]|uniref:hypothetical protein n=1 Tax=Streptomyces sp. NPDC018055 TaxID=3365038 RepID=UPI0037B00A20